MRTSSFNPASLRLVRARLLAGKATLAALLMAGCVIERPRSESAHGPVVKLPAGPIADPVIGATVTSRVTLAIEPLGTIRYDGLVLPLLSPDGRFLAAEEGEPPDWPAILSLPGARPPVRTALAIYDLSGAAPVRVPTAEPLEAGLMLGRSADNQGFLVESPRADGSRWVGRIAWTTGGLAWILKDQRVHAHAVLTPTGAVVCSRRGVATDHSELMLRTPTGAVATYQLPGQSLLFPTPSADPGVIYALVLSDAGLELLAIAAAQSAAAPALGPVRARQLLTSSADAALAYQATVAAGPAAPPGRQDAGPRDPRLLLFHPQFARMAVFDPAVSGFLLLPARSAAAALSPFPGESGYFATTPQGLMFVAQTALENPAAPRSRVLRTAPILADPFVPRVTSNRDRPLILIGPAGSDKNLVQLIAVRSPK